MKKRVLRYQKTIHVVNQEKDFTFPGGVGSPPLINRDDQAIILHFILLLWEANSKSIKTYNWLWMYIIIIARRKFPLHIQHPRC